MKSFALKWILFQFAGLRLDITQSRCPPLHRHSVLFSLAEASQKWVLGKEVVFCFVFFLRQMTLKCDIRPSICWLPSSLQRLFVFKSSSNRYRTPHMSIQFLFTYRRAKYIRAVGECETGTLPVYASTGEPGSG